MTHSMAPLEGVPTVSTGEELSELLRTQHVELRKMLCRLPLLHHAAREDVFLVTRRLLAVHLQLESVLLLPRLGTMPEHFRFDREVEAAEAQGMESIDFDAAQARVGVAFLRHVGLEEALPLTGPLTERERDVVAEALRLWDGSGDVYLGGTWVEMVAAVTEQLADEG
ncbi:hypothetical protein [Nocardioides currus]|uniref:Hemerythrin-like domain-containing protein n=1 Tax=Nocardioides currus TaxID=2133958 RepID=A0A2R7YZZ6_9ACTN|nr:hypothetical protein [Nocardioides currus]PUA81935.1 hypothetical protein C7S10_07795 [Nocardioides currus]